MTSTHTSFSIDTQLITFEQLKTYLATQQPLQLSLQSIANIQQGRDFLESKLTINAPAIYGINTGFGAMCNHHIGFDDLEALQANLVRSHACGLGQEVPKEIIRLMLLLKIQSLSYGNSGVTVATVQRLIDFYNLDILPVIYQQGSLGASGDLAPLAHLALPLMGEGEVYYQDKKISATDLESLTGLEPLRLQAKEGLALLNGTQFMAAYGVWLILEGEKLLQWSNIITALSLDAFFGRIEPFDDLIHQIRPHAGQISVAKTIRELLNGSEIIQTPKQQVQDPYSFRCVPQVHGASHDAINYVKSVFLTEINSVTDNPNLFPQADKIISGGNFHGQPLALALDFLGLALAELGSISERRTYQLIAGTRNLPPFLAVDSGLHSGLMIPQYTAASIVSQNKQLCTPSSADSIVSSNGQEDHVSMGANGATKTFLIIENLKKILAIELLTASQALEFRRPLKTSPQLENILTAYRKEVSFIDKDRMLHQDMKKTIAFLDNFAVN
jgi:histidine ammonia-lyase